MTHKEKIELLEKALSSQDMGKKSIKAIVRAADGEDESLLEPIVGDSITDIIKNSIMCNNDIEDVESNISYAIDQLKRALKSISK